MSPLRQLSLLPLALLVLMLSSCSPRRSEIALNTSEMPAPRLLELAQAADARLLTLKGKGTVSFESPDMGGSAFFELSLRKPDSLLVSLSGPFGIDVGTFFLSRSLFVMYNSMQNHVTTGVPTAGSIRSVIPFDLTYDQIFSAFTGVFPVLEEASALRSYTVEEDRFLLVYDCGGQKCSYWIDPGDLLVRHYTREDGKGQVLIEATTTGTIDEDGARMPRRIVVTFPAEQRRVSIYYSSANLNTSDISFDYTIPPNARKTVR